MGSDRGKRNVLKVLRIANDYTIKEVACLSGCNQSTIYAAENGHRTVTYKTIEKILIKGMTNCHSFFYIFKEILINKLFFLKKKLI